MEAFMLALLMLAAVLVSSVIDQLVPKISSPLIQIGLGLLIALVAGTQIDIIFDEPDLFLVLFIAPLLFYEAKNVDRAALWRNKRPVVSLAIGLVVVAALIIGFTVNWFIPSISLAAAFALGAALGPTDAVAVASLSKETSISPRSKSILEGESLINDAAGIVSFQFALAAAVTGTFSLFGATTDFLFTFIGGILVGVALGYFGNFIVRKVRSWGLENTTFHVLFEVFTPFIVYLAAHQLGTSGILAVVAAALINSFSARVSGPAISRMNIVSTSVWRVLSFTLNGIVFVLLGTQLPRAMQGSWENMNIDNGLLIGYILAITFLLIIVRFIWVFVMEYVRERRGKAEDRTSLLSQVRMAAIMTLGGPKGTITLAIILTMPHAIPQQQLILFMTCGVILVTLLLATFVVPLLAPKAPPTDEDLRCDETLVSLEILRGIIEELAARQTLENRAATQVAIRSYNQRISRIKETNGIENEPNLELRLKTLQWEREYAADCIERKKVDPVAGYQYLSRIDHMENLLKHHTAYWSSKRTQLRMKSLLRIWWHRLVHKLPGANLTENTQAIRTLQAKACEYVIEKLQEVMASDTSSENAEDTAGLLLEYQRTLRLLRTQGPSITAITTSADMAVDIERMGLYLELEQIQTRYEEGDLCRSSAKRMRENVYLMQVDLEDNV